MGFSHRYEAVHETEKDDSQDGLLQPRQSKGPSTGVPVTIAWWKFLLCNLLAAGFGAIAMIPITQSYFETQSSRSTTTNVPTAAALSTVPSATLTAEFTAPTTSNERVQTGAENQDAIANEILDCGYSPEEARAKGCVYDVMMQDWVPEPCYDAVLTEKYLAEGNWTWYADGEGKTTLSDEEMRKGEHGAAWMSNSYHKAHCVFSWQKIIRALRNGKGISQELLSYDHVLHCAHGALKADSNDEGLGVRAPTNYAKCALYESWKLDFIPDKHDSTQK